MKMEYIFPTIMVGLNIASAICYTFQSNWRMVVYWVSAAALTSCVTYGK